MPRQTTTTEPLPAGLYIVATPIGNLADMSLRAIDTLKRVALVACEDTRVTAKLLSHYGIHVPTTSYHDHNAAERRPHLLKRLKGEAIALVSDAGTPMISDPGFKLVEEAAAQGIKVIPIPGASSVMAALAISGLPTDRFLFAGFLPAKAGARREMLAELRAVPATLVFFESARRIADTLAEMQTVLGNRPAAICRELTKLYEEALRGSLGELKQLAEARGELKGEIVLVVGPPLAEEASIDLDGALEALLKEHSLKDAVAMAAAQTALPKKQVYARALELARR